MKYVGLLACLLGFAGVGYSQKYPCLPADVSLTSPVSIESGAAKMSTVGQALKKVKAQCSHGKLIDRHRKEIRFYNLQGCWGNPPADYQELLENQRTELIQLKKKFMVIEIPCQTNVLVQ
jgi:hypothetical protein